MGGFFTVFLKIPETIVIGPLVVKDIKYELNSIIPDRGNLTKNLRSALLR